MKRKMAILVLTGLLTCTLAIPVGAAEPSVDAQNTAEQVQKLPDSVLYYGTVQEIGKDENGTITRLYLESEQYGSYMMRISEETVWIDSGKKTAFDPADLQIGERVYVFSTTSIGCLCSGSECANGCQLCPLPPDRGSFCQR